MQSKLSQSLEIELQKNLKRELGRLNKRIKELKKDDPFSDPSYADDNASIDTDVREQLDHATVSARLYSLTRKRELITYALARIDKGTYGICEKCASAINIERLSVVPEAQYCIECNRKLIV